MTVSFPKFRKLQQMPVYSSDFEARQEAFLAAMNEAYHFHFKHCDAFSKFCKNRALHQEACFSDVSELPFLPVQAFKLFGRDLLKTDVNDEKTFLISSSATSGVPSSISVTRDLAKRQAFSMAKILQSFIGVGRRPFIMFDVEPTHNISGSVGARFGASVGYSSLSSNAIFVLDEDENGQLHLNEEKFAQAIQDAGKSKRPPIVFGFTFVLYDFLKSNNTAFKKSVFTDANVLHIGGWKKLEDRSISKAVFNEMMADVIGVKPSNVIDVYGFTEQMGLNYPSKGLEPKLTSVFADVLVRDISTLEVLPDGEEGLLQFVSPLPNSYPGISVLTDDLGVISSAWGEVDGRFGKTFEITGRAKNAEVRGCGDVMSSYLARSKTGEQISTLDGAKVLFSQNQSFIKLKSPNESVELRNLPKAPPVDELTNKIKAEMGRLKKYSADEIIAFLAGASRQWLEPNSGLGHLQPHGLSFLVNWLSSDNLRALLDQSLNHQRVILDDFVVDRIRGTRMIKATPCGVVGHWLAGNVPLLGMLGYAQALITKNANIIKVPATNTAIMPLLLEKMANTNISIGNGTTVEGKDIVASTAVIYYDRADVTTANSVSSVCDGRIAWGGAEAVSAVMRLERKIGVEDIVFGPKLSFMAIGAEALSPGNNLNKLFRRIATDSSVFDQYACASPHNIFVEKSSHMAPATFCEELAGAMQQMSARIPKARIDAGTASKVIEKRLEFEFRGQQWSSDDTTWTILLHDVERPFLADPTYSRVLNVQFVDDLMDVAELVTDDIQTVSLAMSLEAKLKFANRASELGAVRFPDVGRMTHFEAPWDGVFPVERLVKFCTLGGPLV